jgi:hypothetical protein
MLWNVHKCGKNQDDENLKANIQIVIGQKQLETVEYFKYFVRMIKLMQVVQVKLNPGLPWQSSIPQEKCSFRQQIGDKFKEETSKVVHLEHSFV